MSGLFDVSKEIILVTGEALRELILPHLPPSSPGTNALRSPVRCSPSSASLEGWRQTLR
jgi:hypothetical protein